MADTRTDNHPVIASQAIDEQPRSDILLGTPERELVTVWTPQQDQQTPEQASIEEQLCQRGRVTLEQLKHAQTIHAETPKKRLGQILLEMGAVSEADLQACVAEQCDLPFIRVTRDMVAEDALALLDRAFIETHSILPISLEGRRLIVATSDPTNVFMLDEVQRITGRRLSVWVCTSEDIRQVLVSLTESAANEHLDEIIKDIEEDDVEIVATKEADIADLEREAAESPIIKFVNYIIYNAIKEKASDIHIEPGDKALKLRYRIDGTLFEMMAPPGNMHAAVVSRIKIMANLDIAERRLPQDGRIRVMVHGRDVDMRVSTLPTTHGEKVVMRIIDGGAGTLTLRDLGFGEDTLAILQRQIEQPHGIILVTGPTGSGKSTTLYACLRTMDLAKMNVSTVEDPVEFDLDGITQVHVHDRIGMSFAAALRSLLRQDPDVVMVGEIRDEETARIAVQASLTGHLVLSTLHTNDAPSSITRLINIGIEPYLIAASCNAVLAQRLVRRICPNCKQPYQPSPDHAEFLNLYGFTGDNLVTGAGCDQCRDTGFQGRVGIYEMLTIDDVLRDIVTKNPNVTELRRLCKERGMVTLRDDGFRKVKSGITTIDEVMRVTESTV